MSRRTFGVAHLLPLAVLTTLLVMSCRTPGRREDAVVGKRVGLPDFAPTMLRDVSESTLGYLTICADSLGRLGARHHDAQRCTPCVPLTARTSASDAARHARQLWQRAGRVPWDTLDLYGRCVDIAWGYAGAGSGVSPEVIGDMSSFRLASANDSVRADALRRLDAYLMQSLAAGDSSAARIALGIVARDQWTRAQVMLARPSTALSERERQARQLDRARDAYAILPAIPRTSSDLGESEAQWSVRLFTTLAFITPMPARTAAHRQALAPWVALGEWSALDSASRVLLRTTPGDSVARVGVALAAAMRVVRPVMQQPGVMALFDSALAHMPRSDSSRYDGFDHVLSQDDDDWRRAFEPTRRASLELRGWLVLDPLWITPVNEIRLARRTRIALADFLYADVASVGRSGSETPAGRLLLRLGPPAARARVQPGSTGMLRMVLGWPGLTDVVAIQETGEFWRIFHGGAFLPARRAMAPVDGPHPRCQARAVALTYVECAEQTRADWTGVPFVGTLDTMDVLTARFRAARDSVDLYIGARLPLRRFMHRDLPNAAPEDRIRIGAFLATPRGDTIWHREETRPLPRIDDVAWTAQWAPRIGSGEAMHRVEALEPTRMGGARGVMLFTSDDAISFALSGFGMSDVLVAANATTRTSSPRRWSDLTIQPNGGVIAPRAKFALVWEIYELQPGTDGRLHWKVDVRREIGAQVQRSDIRPVLTGERRANARLLADESDASSLSYTREGPPLSALVESVMIPLPENAPDGRHVVAITVTDLVTGKAVTRSVGVRQMNPRAQVRGAGRRVQFVPIPPR
jgi:hypothetical protein